jgi:hypothetical protein
LLDKLSVDPSADAEGVWLNGCGGDNGGPERRKAVASLRAEIGALIRFAEIIETEIVGRCDARDSRPACGRPDTANRAAYDESNFSFKSQEFSAVGAFNGSTGWGEGRCRLQKIGWKRRNAATLSGARRII